MREFGILLLLAGLAVIGVGIAGRIKAARLVLPQGSKNPLSAGSAMDLARLLRDRPELFSYVMSLLKASDRLVVTGVTLSLVGIVLIL